MLLSSFIWVRQRFLHFGAISSKTVSYHTQKIVRFFGLLLNRQKIPISINFMPFYVP